MHATRWSVDIYLTEEGRATTARALLHPGARHPGRPVQGRGRARRNPEDPEFAEIGEELAAARALRALSDELFSVSQGDLAAANKVGVVAGHR